jgi:hypothetical protein
MIKTPKIIQVNRFSLFNLFKIHEHQVQKSPRKPDQAKIVVSKRKAKSTGKQSSHDDNAPFNHLSGGVAKKHILNPLEMMMVHLQMSRT